MRRRQSHGNQLMACSLRMDRPEKGAKQLLCNASCNEIKDGALNAG
ncbi:hypothetical protein SynROS8604_02117 [Synechococcus sp. ROS8604]|nr:hypothetical protein SynROS8604_02117 [Synechococcus sp. ROS8604]